MSWWVNKDRDALREAVGQHKFKPMRLPSEFRSVVDDAVYERRRQTASAGRAMQAHRRDVGFETPSVTVLTGNESKTPSYAPRVDTNRQQLWAKELLCAWASGRACSMLPKNHDEYKPHGHAVALAAELLATGVKLADDKLWETFLKWATTHATEIDAALASWGSR